jgi:Permuted papain-like amidase enzyme, YaeF/YiiX, C92 family
MPQHPVEPLLKPGDILFTSIPNFLYRRVAQTTGSLTSHVGIAFYDQDTGWLVAESAVPTVRYVTLANFISRSDNGWLVVRRMGNGLSSNQIESLRKECDRLMGKLYHLGFHFLSSRQFCSKFVYETYLTALDVEVGTLESFEALLTSQPETPLWFWRLWFMGRIPWSRITVTPASQLRSDLLQTVWKSPDQASFIKRTI